ncbi:MAG: DUF86 domain-containing protein [Rhodobacteraceae bacterium]|nr:DUF86 domain-containing protein [Paracoccaceae bacterium]
MPHDARSCLDDIVHAADLIESFIQEYDHTAFEADEKTVSAVERQFTIIGEAMTRLHKIAPEITSRIREAREVINFRNVLTHGYDWVEIDNDDLPGLRGQINAILAEMDQSLLGRDAPNRHKRSPLEPK